MPKSRVRFRALDVAIFLFALLIIGLISLQTYVRGRGTPEITIEAADRDTGRGAEQQWIYPLDADTTLRVPGPLGETVVEIQQVTIV